MWSAALELLGHKFRERDLHSLGCPSQLGMDAMTEPTLANDGASWLDFRSYPDLPAEAERALRAAGLAWERESEAEAQLARAAELAPEHLAVSVAHYRYHFYKHHFELAAEYARACLGRVADELAIPREMAAVERVHADFTGDDPLVRFWLFGMQAYGYVLLRLGQRTQGFALLERLAWLDQRDHTKTRALLDVITRPAQDDG